LFTSAVPFLARSLATSDNCEYPLGASIPSDAKNPLKITSDDLVEAKKHYKEHCAICHAENGSGQTETSAGMSPEVPDLRADHIQKLTDGELFYSVKNGVRFTGCLPGTCRKTTIGASWL
jgi:hypothetical protein